jgi:RNA polymerase sigma factor (sigma-70 family)
VPEPALDPDTLRRFAAGDEVAFSAVYRRYARPMFTVALQILGRPELAADAVQQAFVQAWRAAPSYAAESDIAPWLFTITRRAAIDAWRKERRHAVVDPPEELADPATEGRRWNARGRPGRSARRWTSCPSTNVRSSASHTSRG